MRLLYRNWLRTMSDHDRVGCAQPGVTPVLPRANVDVCCDPKRGSFGCDFTGVPAGQFLNTSGAIADVVPFTHVGGWPGDPSWGIIGAVLPYEVWVRGGDDALVHQYYNVSRDVVDFLTAQGDPKAGGLVQFGYYGDCA